MTDLPADVRARYRDLAHQRNWPAVTESAFLDRARWFRDLDEGPAPRTYYEGAADEPGLAGTRWLWEAAVVAGEIIAVKQVEVPPDGIARCYWWRHLEDEQGFLTDQPLDPDGWQLRPVGRGVFYDLGQPLPVRPSGWHPGQGRLLTLEDPPSALHLTRTMRLREYAQLAGGCTQEGHAADRFSAGSVRQGTRRS